MSVPASDSALLALNVSLRAAGQKRLTQREIWQGFVQACPALAAEPEARAVLHGLLTALVERQAIRLPDSRRWDDSQTPPLPTSLELLRDPAAEPVATQPVWLPALAFAAIERQPAQREALLLINAWLRTEPPLVPPVPLRERSLHIFGDEQRLESFQAPEGLFRGKLPMAAIGVVDTPRPLAHEMQPAALGAPLLVLQKLASYDSIRRWNADTKAFAAVVHGGGPVLLDAVEALRALAERGRASAVFYVGDLDPDGLAILDHLRRLLPDVQPQLNLYRWLLHHGRRVPLAGGPAAPPTTLANWPPDLAAAIGSLFADRQRIAQENFGTRELHGWPSARRSRS